jgi:hypothetical protein
MRLFVEAAKNYYSFQGSIIHIVIAISGRSQFSPQASRIHSGIARSGHTAYYTIS